MAHLKVKIHGQIVTEIPISTDRPFTAGRKEGCDFILQGDKGISREHFKLIYENAQWKVKVLSRFGDVYLKGDKIQEATLDDGSIFSVAQYEFQFHSGISYVQGSSTQPGIDLRAINNQGVDDEKTIIGAAPTVPYIKVTDSQGQTKSMNRLEGGDTWVAGREASSQINIGDARVSRKQFEIRRQGSSYFVTDLGSVNGTFLNGNLLLQHEHAPLKSGDAISVLDNFFYFELHDPNFRSRLDLVQSLPPVTSSDSDMGYNNTPAMYEPDYTQQGSVGMGAPDDQNIPPPTPHWIGMQSPPNSGSALRNFDFKKNRIRLIIGAIAVLAIAFSLKPSDDASIQKRSQAERDPLLQLTTEQKALVKQSYQLAKNYYMQGRYESARGELVKMKEFVPEYSDSEKLSQLIDQAIYIQQESVKNERLEKEKIERDQKIQEVVEVCKKKLNPEVEMETIDACLSEIIQFDPTHPKIIALKTQTEKLISDRNEKDIEKKQRRTLIAQLQAIFAKAEKIQKTQGPLESIAAYLRVTKSPLPDPHGLKPKSERMIAAIRSEMDKKSQQYIIEADGFAEQKKLKEAVLSLRKAQRVNPTNSSLQERIDDYVNTLKKQMMVYYQESILEESFGNVDGIDNKTGAKEKWKKIMDLDVPDGEYYKKASLKMKKYGAL